MAIARRGITAMRDPTLDDQAKEKVAQRAALGLFGGFLSITLRSLIAVLASAAVVYAADLMEFVPASAALDRLASCEFILATTALLTAAYGILERKFQGESRPLRYARPRAVSGRSDCGAT
jgi:hypothetical protein